MGMNPDTNRFEPLEVKAAREVQGKELQEKLETLLSKQTEAEKVEFAPRAQLVRPDGSPVPEHWSVFKIGEEIVIKNYTFRVAYIGESAILFEPVGPVIVSENKSER